MRYFLFTVEDVHNAPCGLDSFRGSFRDLQEAKRQARVVSMEFGQIAILTREGFDVLFEFEFARREGQTFKGWRDRHTGEFESFGAWGEPLESP